MRVNSAARKLRRARRCASAAGTTSASTKRATLLRNSSCSGVKSIMPVVARTGAVSRSAAVAAASTVEVGPAAGDHDAVLASRAASIET